MFSRRTGRKRVIFSEAAKRRKAKAERRMGYFVIAVTLIILALVANMLDQQLIASWLSVFTLIALCGALDL